MTPLPRTRGVLITPFTHEKSFVPATDKNVIPKMADKYRIAFAGGQSGVTDQQYKIMEKILKDEAAGKAKQGGRHGGRHEKKSGDDKGGPDSFPTLQSMFGVDTVAEYLALQDQTSADETSINKAGRRSDEDGRPIDNADDVDDKGSESGFPTLQSMFGVNTVAEYLALSKEADEKDAQVSNEHSKSYSGMPTVQSTFGVDTVAETLALQDEEKASSQTSTRVPNKRNGWRTPNLAQFGITSLAEYLATSPENALVKHKTESSGMSPSPGSSHLPSFSGSRRTLSRKKALERLEVAAREPAQPSSDDKYALRAHDNHTPTPKPCRGVEPAEMSQEEAVYMLEKLQAERERIEKGGKGMTSEQRKAIGGWELTPGRKARHVERVQENAWNFKKYREGWEARRAEKYAQALHTPCLGNDNDANDFFDAQEEALKGRLEVSRETYTLAGKRVEISHVGDFVVERYSYASEQESESRRSSSGSDSGYRADAEADRMPQPSARRTSVYNQLKVNLDEMFPSGVPPPEYLAGCSHGHKDPQWRLTPAVFQAYNIMRGPRQPVMDPQDVSNLVKDESGRLMTPEGTPVNEEDRLLNYVYQQEYDSRHGPSILDDINTGMNEAVEDEDRRPVYTYAHPRNVHHLRRYAGYRALDMQERQDMLGVGWNMANEAEHEGDVPTTTEKVRADLGTDNVVNEGHDEDDDDDDDETVHNSSMTVEDDKASMVSGQSCFLPPDDEYISDGEGDANAGRISPCTFALLAQDARPWATAASTSMPTSQVRQRPASGTTPARPQKDRVNIPYTLQFDQDNKVPLTPWYAVSSNPSIIWTPPGVDLDKQEPRFLGNMLSRMNPDAHRNVRNDVALVDVPKQDTTGTTGTDGDDDDDDDDDDSDEFLAALESHPGPIWRDVTGPQAIEKLAELRAQVAELTKSEDTLRSINRRLNVRLSEARERRYVATEHVDALTRAEAKEERARRIRYFYAADLRDAALEADLASARCRKLTEANEAVAEEVAHAEKALHLICSRAGYQNDDQLREAYGRLTAQQRQT